jgi:formylglycine-generating enzyme required for sulfatase activity
MVRVIRRRKLLYFFLFYIITPWAKAQKFPAYTQRIQGTDVRFEMMAIPQGVFSMGSAPNEQGRESDEGPVHPVQIDSLFVGKYEVTWELFELFLNENKGLFTDLQDATKKQIDAISRPTPPFEDPSIGMGKDGFPVINVSPYAVLTFCKWLSAITGRFYRLPTEAEWEYICRAGGTSMYHFGDDKAQLKDYAVYFENSEGGYAPVGSKKPNRWGIFDMHGNVSEWTLDQYEEGYYLQFADSLVVNPWNIPRSLHPRVFRGGSWDDDPEDLRSAARMKSGVYLQRNDPQIPKSFWWYTDAPHIGFRLVSPAKQPTPEKAKKFWAVVLDE